MIEDNSCTKEKDLFPNYNAVKRTDSRVNGTPLENGERSDMADP